MGKPIHILGTLSFVSLVSLCACDDGSNDRKQIDATLETFSDSIQTSGRGGPEGFDRPGLSPTVGQNASATSRAGSSSEDNTIMNSRNDAATESVDDDSRIGVHVTDSGQEEGNEKGGKPNWVGCPRMQPEPGSDCDTDHDTLCTYGDITCSCQGLQWVCPGALPTLDAGEAGTEAHPEPGEEGESEGPKYGPRSDGGIRGPRRGLQEGGTPKEGGE